MRDYFPPELVFRITIIGLILIALALGTVFRTYSFLDLTMGEWAFVTTILLLIIGGVNVPKQKASPVTTMEDQPLPK